MEIQLVVLLVSVEVNINKHIVKLKHHLALIRVDSKVNPRVLIVLEEAGFNSVCVIADSNVHINLVTLQVVIAGVPVKIVMQNLIMRDSEH